MEKSTEKEWKSIIRAILNMKDSLKITKRKAKEYKQMAMEVNTKGSLLTIYLMEMGKSFILIRKDFMKAILNMEKNRDMVWKY